ncbi:AAA family ATPase [Bacillus sp. m3-13]|uniref:AAA family ATPase n=1 Tax=Bacillus sp. m3-13 TaxID=406124 RepID=UPI0001E89DB1|nr:AAA family ATPase [Bacillus sp. m3-13]
MSLLKELEYVKGDRPFVYELLGNEKAVHDKEMAVFLEKCANKKDLIISYKANSTESLLSHWIKVVYEHYQQELPKLHETIGRLTLNAYKISSFILASKFVAGYAAANSVAHSIISGVTAPSTSVSLGQMAYDKAKSNVEKRNNHEIAIKALNKFKEEVKYLNSAETCIIAAIRLLYDLSQTTQIIMLIENVESLQLSDIHFLKAYYSLFQDNKSIGILQDGIEKKHLLKGAVKSKLLSIFCWDSLNPMEIDFNEKYEENTEEVIKFRWFLSRYHMLDNLESSLKHQVINSSVFIGRDDTLKTLESDVDTVSKNKAPIIRRVEGNSGMGKSTLARRFALGLDNRNVIAMQTNFSSENINIIESLTEIRSFLDHIRLELDPSIKERVIKVLKNTQLKQEEKINQIRQIINFSTDAEVIITAIMKMLYDQSLGVIGETMALLGSIKDSMELKKYQKGLFYKKEKVFQAFDEQEQKTMEEIINELLESYINVLQRAKQKSKTVVWMIDDLQWIDLDSCIFLQWLIEAIKINNLPVYLLLLTRNADLESRKTNEKERELKKLTELTKDLLYPLQGFNSDNIRDLIIEGVPESSDHATSVGNLLWKWFMRDNDHLTIEPLFVVEAINLIADGNHPGLEVLIRNPISQKWFWASENVHEVARRIEYYLKNWEKKEIVTTQSILYKKFTPCMIAVIEERLYRLKNHLFENGTGDLSYLIEYSSFFEEPIFFNLLSKLNYQSDMTNQMIQGVEELEHIYSLITKYLPDKNALNDSRLLSHLFGHSIYKEYLYQRFIRDKDIHKQQDIHLKIYKVIDHYIQEIKEDAPESIVFILALKAASHGEKSENPSIDSRLIRYYYEIAEHYTEQYNFTQAEEYAEKAYKLAFEKNGSDDFLTILMLNNLAKILLQNGKYLIALQYSNTIMKFIDQYIHLLYQEALDDLLTILGNVAQILYKNELYEDAIVIQTQLVSVYEANDKAGSVSYLTNINALGIMYLSDNRLDDAIPTLLTAKDLAETLGFTKSTRIIASNLVAAYFKNGNYEEANKLNAMVATGPDKSTDLEELQLINHHLVSKRKNTVEPKALMEIVEDFKILIRNTKELVDEDHPIIISMENNLGVATFKLACFVPNQKDKEQLLLEAEQIQNQVINQLVGSGRVELKLLSELRLNLAETYRFLKKNKEAKILVNTILESEGLTDNITFQCLNKLGVIYLDEEDLDNAILYQKRALATNALALADQERLSSLENLSHAYYQKHQLYKEYTDDWLEKTIETLEEMSYYYKNYYPSDYINAVVTEINLNDYKKELTNTNSIKKKQIGRNDPCYCGSGKKHKKCCGK